MKIGLIGPPQSGKSTLFAAITEQLLDPATSQQERTVTLTVPDERLDFLAKIYEHRKKVEAHIDVCDFPGISSRDEHGKQQYKKHLPHIRLCDVLVAVVRDFKNDAVAPHQDRIDPHADTAGLYDDFVFADLEAVVNRIEKLEKSLKKPSKTHDHEKKELALLSRCQAALEDLKPLSSVIAHEEEHTLLSSFAFLTEKPLIVVVNVSEDLAASEATVSCEQASEVINLCADAEEQIAELQDEDRAAFLEDLGITSPARERIIQTFYRAAGLISFLTIGKEEVRAWPISKRSNAVEAAGKVHTDMARGFIRAETVAWDDFKAADGDMKAVKAAGKHRQEGKTYLVHDGDIINFKFNV